MKTKSHGSGSGSGSASIRFGSGSNFLMRFDIRFEYIYIYIHTLVVYDKSAHKFKLYASKSMFLLFQIIENISFIDNLN